jgi:hypothetical protein
VLAIFIDAAGRELAGADVLRQGNLASGSLYPILFRFEEAGWLKSRWEVIDPGRAGSATRPVRAAAGLRDGSPTRKTGFQLGRPLQRPVVHAYSRADCCRGDSGRAISGGKAISKMAIICRKPIEPAEVRVLSSGNSARSSTSTSTRSAPLGKPLECWYFDGLRLRHSSRERPGHMGDGRYLRHR